MIDREGYGAGFFFKKKPAEPAIEDDYPEQSGLSKKAIVYLVIIGLIIVLCSVYVFQLRSARRGGGQAADPAAVTADTAAAPAQGEGAQTPEEAPAEGAEQESAQGEAQEAAQEPEE